ncbi:MAG: helix-turn-helix domain-containing protein [Acidobacteriota bacterium]
MNTELEPFVDADEIAALLNESRRNVMRMAREGKLTAYLLSGTQRHTYKFRRSEVVRDVEKFRQPCRLMRLANSDANN